MGAAAARALSDTGLDFRAFGDALARIQLCASEKASAASGGAGVAQPSAPAQDDGNTRHDGLDGRHSVSVAA